MIENILVNASLIGTYLYYYDALIFLVIILQRSILWKIILFLNEKFSCLLL